MGIPLEYDESEWMRSRRYGFRDMTPTIVGCLVGSGATLLTFEYRNAGSLCENGFFFDENV
jgi:hypothetical protein